VIAGGKSKLIGTGLSVNIQDPGLVQWLQVEAGFVE